MQHEKKPLLTIRSLTVEDISEVAHIHIQAFPESALTRMGFGIVYKYYKWLHQGPYKGYRTGVVDNDRLIGYCFAGMFRGSEADFIKKNWLFFLWHLLIHPWLLLERQIGARIKYGLEAVKKYSIREKFIASRPIIPRFGILAIAVIPSMQGKGAGKLLISHAEDQARWEKFSSMRLIVHPQNTRAAAFYEKLGWKRKIVKEEWSGLMVKELSPHEIR